MASIHISDFKFGMDRRRLRVAGLPGTLWLGENIHISRGGDIERAKKFVPTFTLPANTFGLGIIRGQLYVFGSIASPTMPNGVQYQRLQAPDGSAMTQVIDARTQDGKMYVIAKYASGSVHHFYDGGRISSWDEVADDNTDMGTLVAYMAELVNNDPAVSAVASADVMTLTAQTPGVDYTIAKSTVNGGGVANQDIVLNTIQPSVPSVAEVRATGTATLLSGTFNPGANRVDQVSVDGVPLMGASVNWQVSHAATAGAVAAQINNLTASHGYSAVAVGAVITIQAAPGTGVGPNGFLVTSSPAGDVVISATDMAGGVASVTAVAKVVTATFTGTFEPSDGYTLTINGTAYVATGRAAGTGTSIFVHKQRVWSPSNSLWNYSKLLDPTDWTDPNVASGAGFINVASETDSNERLVGAASYGLSRAAVFARDATYIYETNTDAELIQIEQALPNTGALSGRAIIAYGNVDVYYLDSTGVRSLRVNSQSGQAYTTDIGGTIDPFLLEYIATLAETVPERAVAIIGPEGRYMLAIGDRIFVLSSFPGYKISAWSYYAPGFSVTDMVRSKQRLYVRAADTLYLYGGEDGTTYPDENEMVATVKLPFACNKDRVSVGKLMGFDMACTGEWLVHAVTDPNNENARTAIGRVSGSTYNRPHIPLPGVTSHIGFDMLCDKAGAATISNLTVYDDLVEAR